MYKRHGVSFIQLLCENMNVLIPNEELEEKMLPSPTDENAILVFASSFDGYKYRDSNQ